MRSTLLALGATLLLPGLAMAGPDGVDTTAAARTDRDFRAGVRGEDPPSGDKRDGSAWAGGVKVGGHRMRDRFRSGDMASAGSYGPTGGFRGGNGTEPN